VPFAFCAVHQDRDAQILERLRARARPGVYDLANPAHDGHEVDLHLRDVHPEAFRVSGESRDLRAAKHDLRGDTSAVVALAAELIELREGDAQAALATEPECDLGPGSAASDDEHIESLQAISIPVRGAIREAKHGRHPTFWIETCRARARQCCYPALPCSFARTGSFAFLDVLSRLEADHL
jgi:hypothetical protein